MVYRALTNMLVLPWPETSDAGQEWAWRTTELGRVVSGATKVFAELQQSAQWSQDGWLLQQGEVGREGEVRVGGGRGEGKGEGKVKVGRREK